MFHFYLFLIWKPKKKVNYKGVSDCLRKNINYQIFPCEEQCFYKHNLINNINEKIFTYTPNFLNLLDYLNLYYILNSKRRRKTKEQ